LTGSPSGSGRTPWRLSAGGGGPLNRLTPTSPFAATIALAVAFIALLTLYVALENVLLLALVGVAAMLAVDRFLRIHPQGRFHGPWATLVYLFVPALYALAVCLFVVDLPRLWQIVAVPILGIGLGVVANAEYLTVDTSTDTYEPGRFLLLFFVYFTTFAIFKEMFTAELPLLLSIVVVLAVALLLTMDMLRELEAETRGLLVQAAAVALVAAEVRLALYFTPLRDLLSAALLLVVFYVMTGLVQNQASGRLDRQTAGQYALILAAGIVIVVVTHLING